MSQELTEERVRSLKAELVSYGKELTSTIKAMYTDKRLVHKQDLKVDAGTMLKILHQDVAELLADSSKQSEHMQKHRKDIEECSRLVSVLADVNTLSEQNVQAEIAIENFNLSAACKIIDASAQGLKALPHPNTEIGSGVVCSLLRRQNLMMRSRLISKIKRTLQECIVFSPGHVSATKIVSGILRAEDMILDQPKPLAELWHALVLLDQNGTHVESTVNEILKNVWFFILQPLWREGKAQSPQVVICSDFDSANPNPIAPPQSRSELLFTNIAEGASSVGAEARAQLVLGMDEYILGHFSHARMPLHQLIPLVEHVLRFLSSEVFCKNHTLIDIVAKKFGDSTSSSLSILAVLQSTLVCHLPKTESELASYVRPLEKPCASLETTLRLCGYMPSQSQSQSSLVSLPSHAGDPEQTGSSNSSTIGPLSLFLRNVPAYFASAKRKEILESARAIVLSDYHNTMIAASGDATEDELSSAGSVGDPRSFLGQSAIFAVAKLKFDSCQTSLASCRLLKLVHETTKAAGCAISPVVGNALLHSARDCLEIFMAIVPVRFADVIMNSPRMGAVFYNDCLYIAHNCTLVTHLYRQQLHLQSQNERERPRVAGGQSAAAAAAEISSGGFADFIPRFRKLGDQCMLGHVQQQCAVLTAYVRRIRIAPEGELVDGELPAGVTALAESDSAVGGDEVDSSREGRPAGASGANTSTTEGLFSDSNPLIEVRPGGLFEGGLKLADRLRGRLVKRADSLGILSSAASGPGSGPGFGSMQNTMTPLQAVQQSLGSLASAASQSMLRGNNESATAASKGSGSDRGRGMGRAGDQEDDAMVNDEEVAAMLVKHLEGLSSQWMSVLQDSTYARVVGFLIETVLLNLMAPVLKARCITESAANEISRVFRCVQKVGLLLQTQSVLMGSTESDALGGSGGGEQLLLRVCPSWRRFLPLTDLLEYNLSEVADWVQRKKFSCFTGAEMISLLKALFEDTPRRQSILDSIRQMAC